MRNKVEKRFSRGHMFLLSHTWAKAIDDSDSTQLSTTAGTGSLQDQLNLRAGMKDRDVWLDAGPVAVPRHGVVVVGPRWWARAIRGEDVRDIGPGDAA